MMLRGSNIRYLLLCCSFSPLLLLGACSSVAKKTDPSKLSPIEAGKSDKNDVLKILGLPNKREVKVFNEGSEEVEFWIYFKGRGRRSISVPFVPTGQSIDLPRAEYIMGFSAEFQTAEKAEIAAVVAFDRQGVVVDMKTEGNEQ